MGYCTTYDEVRKYKQELLERETLLPQIPPGSLLQFSADNVDHNIRTLDGKSTFHGMGVIATITPEVPKPTLPVQRSAVKQKASEVASTKGIPIKGYSGKAIVT